MVFTTNFLFNIIGVIIAILIAVIAYFKWKFTYWKNLGVEYVEPVIPFGNIILNSVILKKVSLGEEFANCYNYFKSKKVSFGGAYIFSNPLIIPSDVDLIKRIMQTDFVHFTDHGGYINERDDPLTANLFTLGGDRWRNLRVKLTPTFTSGKMKMMFPIMVQISKEFVKALEKECEASGTIDAKDFSARFTTDVIGNCAFGLECNSLQDPNTEFRIHGKRIFHLTVTEQMLLFIAATSPTLARLFRIKQNPKTAADFFWNVVKEITEYREQNNVRRNDFLQLLLDMKNKEGGESDTTLTFAEIAAQAFIFFLGGFETSSTVTSFAIFELSLNEEIQNKLRNEIMKTLKENDGDITYDSIMNMRYLDMVVNETLRKYPPLTSLPRLCTKDYRIPGTDVILKKGDGVLIPILAVHRDPELYPNPDKFDPTRFTEENKATRHSCAFIPFGEGPRMCIGLRFGVMQIKVALVAILSNFKLKVNPKTTLPVQLDPGNFNLGAKGGLWIDLEKIIT